MAPLTVHPANPRYFGDASGGAVYLTGSHHWDSLVDNAERPVPFDFPGYLDRLAAWGHNFIRLWALEAWLHPVVPMPYVQTGGKFDLTRFNPDYFGRLRERVVLAGRRGFWVSVMLWNGWSIHDNGEGNPWPFHPLHRANNHNGFDGDPDGEGHGKAVHTLRIPEVTRLQETYAAKVVETVGDLDHVLFEISNESPGSSHDWQCHMTRYLKGLGVRHPVGMTYAFPGGSNADLFAGPADWISPNHRGGYRRSPPPADGSKVVLLDTDHLWGLGGGPDWVWKAFLRGHHPIYMDPLDGDPVREAARRAMGRTLDVARTIDLAAAVPSRRARYCLANCTLGREEIVASLRKGRGRVDLGGIEGEMAVQWMGLVEGKTLEGGAVVGGGVRRLRAPIDGAAVVVLRQARERLKSLAPSRRAATR